MFAILSNGLHRKLVHGTLLDNSVALLPPIGRANVTPNSLNNSTADHRHLLHCTYTDHRRKDYSQRVQILKIGYQCRFCQKKSAINQEEMGCCTSLISRSLSRAWWAGVSQDIAIGGVGRGGQYTNHGDSWRLLHHMYGLTRGLGGANDGGRHVRHRLGYCGWGLMWHGHDYRLSAHWRTWETRGIIESLRKYI